MQQIIRVATSFGVIISCSCFHVLVFEQTLGVSVTHPMALYQEEDSSVEIKTLVIGLTR